MMHFLFTSVRTFLNFFNFISAALELSHRSSPSYNYPIAWLRKCGSSILEVGYASSEMESTLSNELQFRAFYSEVCFFSDSCRLSSHFLARKRQCKDSSQAISGLSRKFEKSPLESYLFSDANSSLSRALIVRLSKKSSHLLKFSPVRPSNPPVTPDR